MGQRQRRLAALVTVSLLGGLFAAGAGVAQAGTGALSLPGSAAVATSSSATAIGDVPSDKNLVVALWFNYDKAGATDYANAVSDPRNRSFHRYLSPSAYTAKFGPSATAADAVRSWLAQQGFADVTVGAQREYVQASAPVATVDRAFQVQMKTFAVAGSAAPVVANDRDLTLPAAIAGDVLGVSGLNSSQPTTNLANPQLAAVDDTCSHYYGQNVQSGLPSLNGMTSFPTQVCGYTGAQVRDAYGMNEANNGKGVTIAYMVDGLPPQMFTTLTTWAAANGLPAPKSTNYQELAIGNGGACSGGWCTEAPLDVEVGYAMAPGAHQLLVSADTSDTGLGGLQGMFNAELAVLDGDGDHPLASITSSSWAIKDGEETLPADYLDILHSIMLRAAGEGVGMYFGSGDEPGVHVPASDPYVVAVGGTAMAIDAQNRDTFQTGWSDDEQVVDSANNSYDDQGVQRWAAGGGTSLAWSEPGYQKGVVPTSMSTPAGDKGASRVVPDISALADLMTGMDESLTKPDPTTGQNTIKTEPQGGTSMATPMIAGMVADAEQGQPTPFGFINPLLYSLAGTSALHDVLPITSATPAEYRGTYCSVKNLCYGNTPPSVWTFDAEPEAQTFQVTAKGYDTMTGVGTPNGQPFITALRAAERNQAEQG